MRRVGQAARSAPGVPPLAVEAWGSGEPVILVHGSLATGSDEWQAQLPLAAEGFRLLVLDRRGYGRSPAAPGEDFLADAADIAALMGAGAHLVGHSYGGLGAMLAAAARPRQTLSLTLLEPATFSLARHSPAASALIGRLRTLWGEPDSDRAWVTRFLEAVGSDPASLPEGLLDAAVPLAGLLRAGRPPWTAELPLDGLARAGFPKLVVSGGHHPGFEALCDALAPRIGAARRTFAGAGHEVQFVGEPLNLALLQLWPGEPGAVRRAG
jgi:pimeloyl-ACP methyl ester carboxylesterase